MPKARRAQAGRVADVMVDKVGSYMIGNLLISLVAGLASFAVFAILGVPFAVPLAFVVAVCDLIPTIGATLGAVICVLAALLTTELWPTTVVVAIFFVVYQQLENYYLAPRILRSTVSLSAPAVLLSGLIGGTVLGLIGALMAIPIAAGLKVVLGERLQARDSADPDPDPDADPEPAPMPMPGSALGQRPGGDPGHGFAGAELVGPAAAGQGEPAMARAAHGQLDASQRGVPDGAGSPAGVGIGHRHRVVIVGGHDELKPCLRRGHARGEAGRAGRHPGPTAQAAQHDPLAAEAERAHRRPR